MTAADQGVSLSEAVEGLTVAEVRVIERHYSKSVDGGGLSGTDLTVAVVWALERRQALADNVKPLPDWKTFDDWTMKRLNAYFAAEAVEVDENDPETDQGKGV